MAVTLPALHLFSTAPKFSYFIVLLGLYHQFFAHIYGQIFLQPFIFLGGLSIVVANCVLFTIKNQVIVVLAWSSIANIGLLFLLFGLFPQVSLITGFLVYYLLGSFFFFVFLQYLIVSVRRTSTTELIRFTPQHFGDLSVVRKPLGYVGLALVLVFSLLNFFGIPPLLGF